MNPLWGAIAAALTGSWLGAILACVPGLHLCLVISAAGLALQPLAPALFPSFTPVALSLYMGLIAGHIMANSIPATLLSASDESNAWASQLMQQWERSGRGISAVQWTASGVLMGAAALLLFAIPLGRRALPALMTDIGPYMHAISLCMIAYVLISGPRRSPHAWQLAHGTHPALQHGMHAALFILAGLLGLAILYTAPVEPLGLARHFVPAILGLYCAPSLIIKLCALPPMRAPFSMNRPRSREWQTSVAEVTEDSTDGLYSQLLKRPEHTALIAHGALKFVIYGGAALLLCVPGFPIACSGQGLLGPVAEGTPRDYGIGISALSLATGSGFLMLPHLARIMANITRRTSPSAMAWGLGAALTMIVLLCAGLMGIAVLAISTGIGVLAWPASRGHRVALGLFLIPLACETSELGALILNAMGNL